MSDRSAAPVRGTLGANQIKWLRINIPPFDEAWKAVQAADAHAEKVKLRLQERKRRNSLSSAAQNVHVIDPHPRAGRASSVS